MCCSSQSPGHWRDRRHPGSRAAPPSRAGCCSAATARRRWSAEALVLSERCVQPPRDETTERALLTCFRNVVRNVLQLCASTDTDTPTSSQAPSPAPVDLVVEIARRVDDVRLRSESARILVNAVRTLFGSATSSAVSLEEKEALTVTQARLSRADVIATVSELVRSSTRHPTLVNEGVVALALLAAQSSAMGEKFALRVRPRHLLRLY